MENQLIIKQNSDIFLKFQPDSSDNDDSSQSDLIFQSGSDYTTNHTEIDVKTENIEYVSIELDEDLCNIFSQTTEDVNCLDDINIDTTTDCDFENSVDDMSIDSIDIKEEPLVEGNIPENEINLKNFSVDNVETSSVIVNKNLVCAGEREKDECPTLELSDGETLVQPCSVLLDPLEVSRYFSSRRAAKRNESVSAAISALQAELQPKTILQNFDEVDIVPTVELDNDSGSDSLDDLEYLPWNHSKWYKKSNESKLRKHLVTVKHKPVKQKISKIQENKESQFNSHSDGEKSDIDIETVEEDFNPIPVLLQKSSEEKKLLSKLKKRKKGKLITIDPTETKTICSICNRKYSTLAYLNIHIKKKHGKVLNNDVVNKYFCSFCTCVFKHEQNLKAHFNLVHDTINKDYVNIVIGTLEANGKNIYANEDNRLNLTLDQNVENGSNVGKMEEMFVCEFCKINFRSKCMLENHIKYSHLTDSSVNSSKKENEAEVCSDNQICVKNLNPKKYKEQKIDYAKYIQNHENSGKASQYINCPYCHKAFKSDKNLIIHCTKFHNQDGAVSYPLLVPSADYQKPNFFQCNYCPGKFHNESRLDDHKILSHFFPCSNCEKRFSTKLIAKHHKQNCLTIESSSINFPDELPDAIFTRNAKIVKYKFKNSEINTSSKLNLSENIQLKTGYACQVCSKLFSDPRLFYVHTFSHKMHKEKINDCLTCKSKFYFTRELIDHSNKIHNDKLPFKCKVCLNEFKNKLKLVKHVNCYHNSAFIFCIHCKKDIRSNEFFIKKHFNNCYSKHKSNICSLCMKILADKKALTVHIIKHTKSQTGGGHCKECINFFYTKKNLEFHMLQLHSQTASSTHVSVKKLSELSVRGLNLIHYASVSEGVYKCIECEKVNKVKTFKNKYSFQCHAFIFHDGQQRKVFPCPACGKEFSHPGSMKYHMKTVCKKIVLSH